MLESFGFEIVRLIYKLISNVLFLVNGTMDIVKCIYIYFSIFHKLSMQIIREEEG